jgi:hypothetical protein
MLPRARLFQVPRILMAVFLLALVVSSASATIRYTVSIEHPERHIFHVSMDIPDVTGEVTVRRRSRDRIRRRWRNWIS